MNLWHIFRRNLRHYRWQNLALAAGAAVASAVLTGALLVGDSIRGSLADLALQRLGPVSSVVQSQRPFRAQLADAAARHWNLDPDRVAPALLLTGGASRNQRSGLLAIATAFASASAQKNAGEVQIGAADLPTLAAAPGHAIINDVLASALDLSPGDRIFLSVPVPAPGGIIASRARDGRIATLSLTVARIETDSFPARFSLIATQRPQPIAWVNLADLQQATGQPGRANTLLIMTDLPHAPAPDLLPPVFTLADHGLSLAPADDGFLILRSAEIMLPAAVERAASQFPQAQLIFAHLINSVRLASPSDHAAPDLHYAIAAGLTDPPGGPLAPDEIALNAWAASQLGASPGDTLDLTYFLRDLSGQLVEENSAAAGLAFRVARILPMTGLAAEPSLTPEYPGVTDAQSIARWQPPPDLPIDLSLVTDADEQYWHDYRAAPKLLLNLDTAQRLWAEPHTRLTGVRIPADQAPQFTRWLEQNIPPAEMGIALRHIRQEQLAAAHGSTDFSQLFAALSALLIISAGLLMALLQRLNIDQRSKQLATMLAVGFSPARLRRLMLAEGLTVAAAGALCGLIGALAYASLIMLGLRTWWSPAVGTSALQLHASWTSPLIGLVASLAVATAAIAWAVRLVGRASAAQLLAARTLNAPPTTLPNRWPKVLPLLALATLAPLFCFHASATNPAVFILAAALALAAGLLLLVYLIQPRPASDSPKIRSLPLLAFRYAGQHPWRSFLTMGLLAAAAFLLTVVSAFRHGPPSDPTNPQSGTGGFSVIVQTGIPLPNDLSTPAARRLAGVASHDDSLWANANFLALQKRPGQDISCLNITRPSDPAIIAVPTNALAGRFTFARTIRPEPDPWTLLDDWSPGRDIPVITDAETAQYILKMSIGDVLTISDSLGRPQQLQLVATLATSIFQGELLMGDTAFNHLFPTEDGFRMLLLTAPPNDAPMLAHHLRDYLDDYAVSVHTAADYLARYFEVANTYLATFQVLGGLGLALGSVGLAVVLLRNLLERKPQLALLAALGFSTPRRAALIFIEQAMLLFAGLFLGFFYALIGAAFVAIANRRTLEIDAVFWSLFTAAAIGLLLPAIILWRQKPPAPADLRSE